MSMIEKMITSAAESNREMNERHRHGYNCEPAKGSRGQVHRRSKGPMPKSAIRVLNLLSGTGQTIKEIAEQLANSGRGAVSDRLVHRFLNEQPAGFVSKDSTTKPHKYRRGPLWRVLE